MSAKINLIYIRDPEIHGTPLSLGYLKTYSDSVLKGRVHSEILELDTAAALAGPAAAAAAFLKTKPDIAGFSCYLWNIDAIILTAKALKKAAPSVRIMLGGPDATGRGAAVLRESGCDVLINGEGELTFVDLLERFLSGKAWAGTPGTIALVKGKAVEGPPREPIADLDIIPSPYLAGIFDGKRYMHMVYETSRGCPFKCAFCAWTIKGRLRYFSVRRAVAEAEWIAGRAPDADSEHSAAAMTPDVFVADQDMSLNGKRARAILGPIKLLSRGKKLIWLINCGLERWARELAAACNSSNFEFDLGIESVNPGPLKACGRKPLTAGQFSKSLAAAKKLAPEAKIVFQLILGLPGDTPQGFMESLRRALEACAEIQPQPAIAFKPQYVPEPFIKAGYARPVRASVQVFHLSILPGSRFDKEGAKEGIVWDKQAPYAALSLKDFSPAGFDLCYQALELADSLTRGIFGQSMVQFADIRGHRRKTP